MKRRLLSFLLCICMVITMDGEDVTLSELRAVLTGDYDPDRLVLVNGTPITREQLAVMLWRYAGSPASSHSLEQFTDADRISSYAWEAVRWANENGIVNGFGNGLLEPQGNATRAQVAQMLKNFMENIK